MRKQTASVDARLCSHKSAKTLYDATFDIHATAEPMGNQAQPRVHFLTAVTYAQPLDETTRKKMEVLSGICRPMVWGFTSGSRSCVFSTAGATFHLLPRNLGIVGSLVRRLCIAPVLLASQLWREPDAIVVAQGPLEGFTAALVLRVNRLFGRLCPLIVESHGDFMNAPFLQRPRASTAAWQFLWRAVCRVSLRAASAFRCVSSATEAQLTSEQPGIPRVRFAAWTDLQTFLGVEREGAREPLILFAGGISRVKGIDVLVEAFARVRQRHPHVQLEIIGRCFDAVYLSALQQRATALGVGDALRFQQELTQRELAVRMARATVLALPSRSEGLGRVILEAFACGTPAVGARVGGIPDLISHGETGLLVAPDDVAALAEALCTFFDRPGLSDAFGSRARARVGTLFSTDAYREGYAKLFRLVRQRSGSACGAYPKEASL